jgi:hypothetical protein
MQSESDDAKEDNPGHGWVVSLPRKESDSVSQAGDVGWDGLNSGQDQG